MIVCICHRVSDRDIARSAQSGCESFDELQFELLVATACGKCHDCAYETFQRHTAGVGGAACAPVNEVGVGRQRPHAVIPIVLQQQALQTTAA